MARLDRRNMLKAMAATAGGVAAAATSGLLSPITGLARSGPLVADPRRGTNNASTPSSPSAPKIAGTVGTTYRSYAGINFKVLDTDTTYHTYSGSDIYQSANQGFMPCHLDLPNGALITEASVWVLNNAAGTTYVVLSYFAADGSSYITYAGNNTSTVLGTIQRLDFTFSPLLVDTATNDYCIFWYPGVLGSSDRLYGARVGYIHQPGLTTFPNPRRVVSATSTSNQLLGPFDATLTTGLTSSGVPVGAAAAFCAVQSYQAGVLTLYPDGASDPGIANYSGTGNLGASLNMIYMLVPLSAAGKFRIHSYIAGNIYVDVWGYLLSAG
jgi:hypothetical protein